MTQVAEVYRFIECNRSLEKLILQNLSYPIRTAYSLIRAKRSLDEAIEYVMERLGLICGGDVDFENLTDEQNIVLNTLLSQEIEVDLPDIDIEHITNVDNVSLTPSDIENILFLFEKRAT